MDVEVIGLPIMEPHYLHPPTLERMSS